MRLLVKFPTRSRPDKFSQTFLRYQRMLSQKHPVFFVISMDSDDVKMNKPTVKQWLNQFKFNTTYFYGNSKNKIEAVNADMKGLDFDILLLASDDMLPLIHDYDDIIIQDMKRFYPDLDGVLHYNDGRTGNLLNTLCVFGKKYYNRFNYIYNPQYESVYADNEFTDVSKLLNKTTYINKCIIKHAWVDHVGYDELMVRNENRDTYNKDKAIYEDRKTKNFGLELTHV